MSATNPVQLNLEVLLTQIKEERDRSAPSSRRRESAGDEILIAQILAATADIERQATAEGLDPVATLRLVAARTLTLTQASGVAVGLVSENEIVCRANAGNAPDVGARIELGKGLSGECIRTGKTVRSEDTAEDARVDPAAGAALNLRSAVAVPIRFEGKAIGVFEVFSAAPNAFDDWAVLAVGQIAQFVGKIASAAAEVTNEVTAIEPPPLLAPDSLPSAGRRFFERLRGALHMGLLLLAAVVTVIAASYSVREMLVSARARRRPELALPGPVTSERAAVPLSTVVQDSAIAREDGRIPKSAISGSAEQTKVEDDRRPRLQVPATDIASTAPRPVSTRNTAAAELRSVEAAPNPPALAAVQPPQGAAALAPLMTVPVSDPQLAVAPPPGDARQPKASIFALMSRKLKGLVQRDPRKASALPKLQNPESQPSTTTQ